MKLDEFIVMPNHLYGIIWITDDYIDITCRDEEPPLLPNRKPTFGQIIADYKYQTIKIINQIDQTFCDRIWQRNIYEQIVCHQRALDNIRQYIVENPRLWQEDPENPKNFVGGSPGPKLTDQPVEVTCSRAPHSLP